MAMRLSRPQDQEGKPAKASYIGAEALSGEVSVDLGLISSMEWVVTGSANGKLELVDISSPLRLADSLVVKMPAGYDMRQFRRGSEV